MNIFIHSKPKHLYTSIHKIYIREGIYLSLHKEADKMKLMTKELANTIPKLGSTEEITDPEIVAHYFNPFGNGDWYVIEGEKQTNEDWLFYGYVKSPINPAFDEYGYFTLNELESVKLFGGCGIERDLYWVNKTVEEIK